MYRKSYCTTPCVGIGIGGGFGMDKMLKFYVKVFTVMGFGWLVGCFGFKGPLRQYFSLYRAVSQREGERGEKG